MTKKSAENPSIDGRPRIALITNHGYAGVEIPVGGAPDTGGQNFYVNSLAAALEANQYEVTIFARGGFPFFGTDKIRQGTQMLSEHVRYVYVPGGGDSFLIKEDIAIALDEETEWLDAFIATEAAACGQKPWEYYDIVNTHYWDAAIMGVKLVERWQNRAAFEFLETVLKGKLSKYLKGFSGENMHRLGLSRELDLHLGEIARRAASSTTPSEIIDELTGKKITTEITLGSRPSQMAPAKEITRNIKLGHKLKDLLALEGETLFSLLAKVDTHVWTPHSLGIIKERNFWNKDKETIRKLKFRERDAHEDVVCRRTNAFCSTSQEITRSLVSYHGQKQSRIFDFPPCIDGTIFKPRSKEELGNVYRYLAEHAGVSPSQLMESKIIFETSRMDRTKRKDILLQAFAQVAEKRDDVFLFIGGGPAGNPIFQSLEELKNQFPILKDRAFLLGFVPDEIVEPLFSLGDLFVSASEMEGFGMSVSQAAAAGVAVISSDLIPFATQYAPNAAVIVPAGDVDGFATAMLDLLNNDKERNRRASMLQEIAGDLDWVATSRRFIQWYADSK